MRLHREVVAIHPMSERIKQTRNSVEDLRQRALREAYSCLGYLMTEPIDVANALASSRRLASATQELERRARGVEPAKWTE